MRMILIMLLVLSFDLFASGDHSAGPLVLKKGGAVSDFSEVEGFKLSAKAIKVMGIEYQILPDGNLWQVPKTSLVYLKHSVGVFRLWNGWNTLVLVKVHNLEGDLAKISSVDLRSKDSIAIAGVKFLRMIEADLNSDTVDSCSH